MFPIRLSEVKQNSTTFLIKRYKAVRARVMTCVPTNIESWANAYGSRTK